MCRALEELVGKNRSELGDSFHGIYIRETGLELERGRITDGRDGRVVLLANVSHISGGKRKFHGRAPPVSGDTRSPSACGYRDLDSGG